jgi:membrane fusion protein (multidrug efflux system)
MSARAQAILPCLALAALLAACGGGPGDGPKRGRGPGGGEKGAREADTIAVRVAAAEQRDLSELWSTSATLRPEQQATVTARTSGVVERLAVEEGAWVRKNEVLAVLEDDELAIALEKAQIAQETKRLEHERAAELHGKGLLAEESFQQKRREAREAANAAELARLNLSRTVIRAPFAGQVLKRYIDVGVTVGMGTEVYDLADVDPLEAEVNVPEPQVARMKPGQAVRITTDAGGAEADAQIDRIAPSVNPETGTVKVTLAVDAAAGLRPGSFVRVNVVTQTHHDATVVPRAALVAEGRRWHLFALAEDRRTVERISVSPGLEEDGNVEVLAPDGGASPIAPGREVVVLGAPALSDGARVSVAGDEPEPEATKPEGRDGERS